MLVLSRKPDEYILIGDDIKITICEITGGKVKVGITAPRNIAVVRGELVAKQQQEGSKSE